MQLEVFDDSIQVSRLLLIKRAELDYLKINVKKLYLDRGFFNTPVIRWLQALDIPFMMPAVKTGKQGGIKQLLKGKKSYKTTYTITRDKDDLVTFDLWIVCKYRKGKHLLAWITILCLCCLQCQNKFRLHLSRLSKKIWH